MPYVPMHQFSSTIALEHRKFLFDVSFRYNGEMLTEAGLFENANTSRIASYFTTDIGLNYKIIPQATFFLNVNNVANEVYIASLRPAGLRPGLPRTFNIGLKGNF